MYMKLPAYPLLTIDPLCSVWAEEEELNFTDTILWSGYSKKLEGFIRVDGIYRRFLGKGHHITEFMWQTDLDITPLASTFTLETDQVRLKVKFWSPFFLDDWHLLSMPIGFIDYEVDSIDGREHEIRLHLNLHENFCGEGTSPKVYESFGDYGVLYHKKQEPLAYGGDNVEADWGYYYLFGENVVVREDSHYRLTSIHSGKGTHFTATDMIAFDDTFSIEYMGKQLKGLWTEKYKTIQEAAAFCRAHHDCLLKRVREWDQRILEDAKPFGEDYQKVVSAAFRQVLAAHKLVRDTDGKILYFSKECLSNGCMNTVDLSYPAMPLFLLYAPELLPGMMNAIFEFASLEVWKFPYSPHDIGLYPLGGGQFYSCYLQETEKLRNIYKMTAEDKVYKPEEQMPVENSGNMLILIYAYYKKTGDLDYIQKHYDFLKQWADYLVEKGDCSELQLCTDDFAGKFKGNINLAIKAAVAIGVFGKVAELCGQDGAPYFQAAASKAAYIEEAGRDGGHLAAAFDRKPSWSLKYNLIWDRIFRLKLFSQEIYKGEVALYLQEEGPYGVPLNSFRTFTKSDWTMWVSALDDTGKATQQFAATMVKVLASMKRNVPFPDLYDTEDGRWLGMLCHRSVQGGLWMPVLARQAEAAEK